MTREPAPLTSWLIEPLSPKVLQSVNRLRASDDVQHVALMPDVHLAEDVCVGAIVATEQLLYPAAVGGDIGCGMLSLAFDADSSVADDEQNAARILAGLYKFVPWNKHRQPREFPAILAEFQLSDPRLQKAASRDGRVQLGTLGRGNHFLELQADQEGRLWVTIHSGSRAVGQVVTIHHLENSRCGGSSLKYLEATEESGQRYLNDVAWARAYAAENRRTMLVTVVELMHHLFGVTADWNSLLHGDHNHVQQESHVDKQLWVHRKGAQSAQSGEPGIIPGSMGTFSFHTVGRGEASALMSCSHGAGRALSRAVARHRVTAKEFSRQLGSVWYDRRIATKLHEEAPVAYKDIRKVMKAQRELAQIVRELQPLLTYKGV